MKNLFSSLTRIFIYSSICYAMLLPLKIYTAAVSFSLVVGFTWSMINALIIQLRKNEEKTPPRF